MLDLSIPDSYKISRMNISRYRVRAHRVISHIVSYQDSLFHVKKDRMNYHNDLNVPYIYIYNIHSHTYIHPHTHTISHKNHVLMTYRNSLVNRNEEGVYAAITEDTLLLEVLHALPEQPKRMKEKHETLANAM